MSRLLEDKAGGYVVKDPPLHRFEDCERYQKLMDALRQFGGNDE